MGPSIDDNPKAMPNIEVNKGRFRRGTSGIVIIIEPEKTPADPKPATARPTMNVGELGAAAHSAEPASKTTIERR